MKKNTPDTSKTYRFILLLIIFTVSPFRLLPSDNQFPWEEAKAIANNIVEPVFKPVQYNITDYGAVADGITICTEAVNKAIQICSDEGGGMVIVPKGTYLVGAIRLKSNVNLHLEKDATLKFLTDPKEYLPVVLTRWEGVDCYNYSPLVYAFKLENVAITGAGTLDGQSDNTHWWPWKGKPQFGAKEKMNSQLNPAGRDRLMEFNTKEVPVEQRQFGEGHFLRPPFIQFYQCNNILIEGITIINSPFWVIHPVLCQNITVRKIHVNSLGPNNDGFNPESCKNVLIEKCRFNTGDDCIAIKSGRNHDGRRWNIPSENIVIRNCEMKNGHGGVVIGSEISGGCRNVFVYDCKMDSPELDRAIRIKTNAERGGTIENVFVKNIEVGTVKEAVLKINCLYEIKSDTGNFPPLIRNIYLENITSRKSKYPVYITGLKTHNCIHDIFLSQIQFNGVDKDPLILDATGIYYNEVFINGKQYPPE